LSFPASFSLVRLASPSSQIIGLLLPLARICNPCYLLGSFGGAKEPERSGARRRQMNKKHLLFSNKYLIKQSLFSGPSNQHLALSTTCNLQPEEPSPIPPLSRSRHSQEGNFYLAPRTSNQNIFQLILDLEFNISDILPDFAEIYQPGRQGYFYVSSLYFPCRAVQAKLRDNHHRKI